MKIFAGLIFLIGISSCAVTKIYLVRHAEKTGNTANADLKAPEGFARAVALKDSLHVKVITSVYSTNVPRTFHTAEAVALDHSLPVVFYANADSLADALVVKKNKRFVVVGHSNTVPQMIRRLGLDPGITGSIPDNDYDNLFVITLRWKKGTAIKTLEKKTYGELSP